MKLTKLDYKGFEEYIVQVSEMPDRLQYRFLFENGYGASVIKGKTIIGFSYGGEDDLFELALTDSDGENCYSESIKDTKLADLFNDVVGRLNNKEVLKYLEKIRGVK